MITGPHYPDISTRLSISVYLLASIYRDIYLSLHNVISACLLLSWYLHVSDCLIPTCLWISWYLTVYCLIINKYAIVLTLPVFVYVNESTCPPQICLLSPDHGSHMYFAQKEQHAADGGARAKNLWVNSEMTVHSCTGDKLYKFCMSNFLLHTRKPFTRRPSFTH